MIAGQLPLAADLLAACVAVGAGPREAAEEVGRSIGGPVGDRLARTAVEIRLGGEPAESWGR
ncbi:Type II secretion system (T2SS), protein F, partial [Streptomyces sp. Ncost-T6T-2b]